MSGNAVTYYDVWITGLNVLQTVLLAYLTATAGRTETRRRKGR